MQHPAVPAAAPLQALVYAPNVPRVIGPRYRVRAALPVRTANSRTPAAAVFRSAGLGAHAHTVTGSSSQALPAQTVSAKHVPVAHRARGLVLMTANRAPLCRCASRVSGNRQCQPQRVTAAARRTCRHARRVNTRLPPRRPRATASAAMCCSAARRRNTRRTRRRSRRTASALRVPRVTRATVRRQRRRARPAMPPRSARARARSATPASGRRQRARHARPAPLAPSRPRARALPRTASRGARARQARVRRHREAPQPTASARHALRSRLGRVPTMAPPAQHSRSARQTSGSRRCRPCHPIAAARRT